MSPIAPIVWILGAFAALVVWSTTAPYIARRWQTRGRRVARNRRIVINGPRYLALLREDDDGGEYLS